MTKDKKEEVDIKKMYGEATVLSSTELMKKQKINLEKGLSNRTSKRKIRKVWL